MKKYRFFYIVLCLVLLCGCSKKEKSTEEMTYIYYTNIDGTGLVGEECELEGKTAKEQAEFCFEKLSSETDSIDYNSPYPEKVKVKSWKLNDTDLEVNFNVAYKSMNPTQELLLRAATVQTMVQIKGIDYVRFFVEGKPLTDKENREIGYMRKESFVDNTGDSLRAYQDAKIRLFFASQTGEQLVEEERSVRYNSNTSVEKMIVEQLMKGPKKEGSYPVIPPETKLLGVTVRDGICYVNFDEGFLNPAYQVTPQVAVYSIVNSVIEGGEVSKVQILINGESTVEYQGNLKFEDPFVSNLELVKENN